MAWEKTSTSTSSPAGIQHPGRPAVLPTYPDPHAVFSAASEAVSEDQPEVSRVKTPVIVYPDVTGTVSELNDRKQRSRLDAEADRDDRSCIFEAAYPRETERNSLSSRITNFCFRNFGLCSQPATTNKAPQVSVSKPSDGYGIWSTELHSMCAKLAVYIGTTEYILGPRLAWHYGGFIFYFVVIFLILFSSFPVNLLESLLGQYSAKSVAVVIPQLGPGFRGLGYAMLFITGMILVYYAVHVANILVYAYHAAQVETPWLSCSADYNSKRCFTEKLQERCNQRSNYTVYHDFKCVPAPAYCRQNGFTGSNGTHCLYVDRSNLTSRWMVDYDELKQTMSHKVDTANVSEVGSVGVRYSSTRDFHYHYIHGRHECEANRSLPVCRNHARAFALAYCTVWVLALLPCFNLWIASSFAVIVIVASPLVIMLVMTRVILFPGAWAGVSNFFFGRANLRHLLTTSFWVDAFGMTFWSIVVGTGVVPTLSSRDRQRHGALRSSTILVTADMAFGLLNSLLLFSVRGHLELDPGLSKAELRQLDDDSEALVFVAFTTITDGMPRPRFWGSIYFGTMAAQSLATIAMFIVAAALNLVDAVPSFRGRPFSLAVLVAGSPFVLAATVLVVSVLNDVRLSVYPLVRLQLAVIQLLFIVVVGFKLSTPEFRQHVQLQLGIDVRGMWRWMTTSWLIICPLILVVEILGQLTVYAPPPIPSGALPTAVFAYGAMACPSVILIVGFLYSARTTPFWELFSTTKEFGVREQRPRQPSASRHGSGRTRRAGSRQGRVGVERSRTGGDVSSGRIPTEMAAVTSEETRWDMAKTSTLLSVA